MELVETLLVNVVCGRQTHFETVLETVQGDSGLDGRSDWRKTFQTRKQGEDALYLHTTNTDTDTDTETNTLTGLQSVPSTKLIKLIKSGVRRA